MTTLKKQKIYFWTPETNRLKLGMKKVSPTTDEIFIIRNVRNVYVEVWKNPTSDSYWDIS